MRSNVFLTCALMLTSLAMPQALPYGRPADASTTTATLTTIFPIANETFCGVGSVTIPFTGEVRITFHSTVPMDFYILRNLDYIPCGQHLGVADLASDGCILAEWNATELELNQSLPSIYFIFLVAWGKAGEVNGATAAIIMSRSNSNVSTTQVNLTPYTTTSPIASNLSTSEPSLQMPQPPQTAAATQPSSTIPEAALGAVMVAAVTLYLLVRRHVKQSQKARATP